MKKSENILEKIKKHFATYVFPLLNELDTDSEKMKSVFLWFRKNRGFSVYSPEEYGGIEFSHEEKIEFQEIMGNLGGAFAFLQVQTGTAAWLINLSENIKLKNNYLNALSQGELTFGNSTYYMKSTSNPLLTGTKVFDGYRINGVIQFVSGWEFFDELLIGFFTDDNKEVFAMIPFTEKNINKSTIRVGNVHQTMSMCSIGTVSVNFDNFHIPHEKVVIIWAAGTFYSKYQKFPPFAYKLGIAQAAMDLIEEIKIKLNPDFLSVYNFLNYELEQCRNEIRLQPQKCSTENLFAKITDISWRCVQFSVVVSGGKGLLVFHSAQRLYREIVMWILPRAYPQVIKSILEKKIAEV